MSDILDLIDGAIEDYVLSSDAMRWQPEPDVRAEAHIQAAAYGQSYVIAGLANGWARQMHDALDAWAAQLVPAIRAVQQIAKHLGHEQPPTDPRERALWHVRNRNTGPKQAPRAPRKIEPRRSR